jgi:hypothetical protein
MGTKSLTMHGSRAIVQINGKTIGIFGNCSYGVRYDANPVFILGRFNPAEIALTGQEAIEVQCSGFRIIDNGPYKIASVPMLQDLLNHEDITLQIVDRQTQKVVMAVEGVRPTGYSTEVSSRQLQSLQVSFMGISIADESGDQEDIGAVNYPTP